MREDGAHVRVREDGTHMTVLVKLPGKIHWEMHHSEVVREGGVHVTRCEG